MRVQTHRTLLLLSVFILLLALFPIGVAQGAPGSGTATLRASLPAGTVVGSNFDPWLNEGWLLNLTGTPWTFTVKVTENSNTHVSYDTHLIVALNNASYENLVDLTINDTTTIPKAAFQYGTPEPYNLGWTWPDDVYPTWFNDTYISLGIIQPFEDKEVNVSATFLDPTDARIHFDAYGKAVQGEIQSTGDIIRTPNSEDSTVISAGPPNGIPPHASFTISPMTPYTNETVTFNATASYDPDGNITSYAWNFGDNTTGSGVVVNHTYAAAGVYTVTLNVTDNEGLWDTDSKSITVLGYPVANFTVSPDPPYYAPANLTFDASSSTPDGGTIISYAWDFETDSVIDAFGAVVWKVFVAGIYNVTLNVTDSTDLWDTESKSITVLPVELIDDIGILVVTTSPLVVYQGEPIYVGVVVDNHGTEPANFTVQITLNQTVVATSPEYYNLQPGTNVTINMTLDTTNLAPGDYVEGIYLNKTSGVDTHPEDNYIEIVITILPAEVHDVAVVGVVVEYPWGANQTTGIYPGWVVNISVTVKNNGTVTESFDVAVYYENVTASYAIGVPQTVINLAPGGEATLKFSWNTTGVAYSLTPYTVNATASTVPDEIDTTNNGLTTTILVKLPGDIDGDGDVDFFDLLEFAKAYGSTYPNPPYNPATDFDGDGDVDFQDLLDFAKNYGKTYT